MKANAPEKIYLQENTTTDCYGEFWPEWFEARAKDSDIEYTRTDAFIEKACEFIGTFFHPDDTKLREVVFEQFKTHMKGE